MSELPPPLTPGDCDCTDLDGFMLNVERLMASELVALSSHEVVGACLFLWCRAWKQHPAASLPDDDRVLAAFAKLPLVRFKKLKPEIMHGFVKCNDGRLYHGFLAREAKNAFERKLAFQRRREGDANRLRNWRSTRSPANINADETLEDTRNETDGETRFVAEGQGQGQGLSSSSFHSEETHADAPHAPSPAEPRQRPAKPRQRPFPKAEFEGWYGGYPHKVGRGAAEKAFAQAFAAPGVSLEALVAGRDAYVRSKPVDQPWCNPATWLNQRRWLDQPARVATDTHCAPAASAADPRIDLGGIAAPHSTIRSVWSQGRWPSDWGPRPDQAGCRISADLMFVIMAGHQTENAA